MGTRSNIVYQPTSGKRVGLFLRIYVHSDGYLEHMGKMLIEHYNSEARAAAIVKLGACSFLDRILERPATGTHKVGERQEGHSLFYKRDRNTKDDNNPATEHTTLVDALDGNEGWVYLWKTGAWWVLNHAQTVFVPLSNAVMGQIKLDGDPGVKFSDVPHLPYKAQTVRYRRRLMPTT